MTDRPDAPQPTAPPNVPPTDPLAAARAHLQVQARRSLRALWVERLAAAAWPVWAVAAAFVGLALAGAFDWLSAPLHAAVLAGFAVALGFAVRHGLRGFRRPSAAEARARLEAEAPDLPASALDDRLALGGDDPAARAVWAAHQSRMAARAAALRAAAADLRVAKRDPWALRLAALVVLLGGLLAGAGRDAGQRLEAALSPGFGGPAAAAFPPSVEAWATPPAYTGAPTIYLTERIGTEVALPAGTRVSLRVYNAAGTPALSQDVTAEDAALTAYGEATWDLQLQAETSGALEIALGGRSLADWRFAVTADAPPTGAFAGPPGGELVEAEGGEGKLQIDFRAGDDHGVAEAWARLELDLELLAAGAALAPPPPGMDEAVEIPLPLPFTGTATEVEDSLIADLSEHPWAGLPVRVTLFAEDGQGQRAQAGPVSAVLPVRPFHEPMARAFLEERRAMVWSLSNLPEATLRLKAVTAYPEDYFGARTKPYLVARTAIRRVDYALEGGPTGPAAAEAAGDAVDLLWRAALLLEEGDLSSAAERLRRARERLSDALERGADEQEIARLMDELREAMREFLSEMARRAMDDGEMAEGPQDGDQGRELSGADLQQMLDEIEQMARDGDMETAQQMLDRLAQMLENLQMQARRGEGGEQGEGGLGDQAMEELNDMLRRQQELADRSFEELQQRQGQGGQQGQPGGQPGQPGQPGGQAGRDPGQGQGGREPGEGQGQGEGRGQGQGMGDEARRQQALRQMLDDLRGGLPGGGGEGVEEALREADRAMGGARESLDRDDPGAALDDQVRAMEALRDGARELAEEMRRQAQSGEGDGEGLGDPLAGEDGRDPLGRPTANRGAVEGSDTRVPGEEALKRARELLDEIRRRSGDRTRPAEELDYLRRLLDRF